MAETSKNNIYYNDNVNSVADVLADMKKMAESTDDAIENSKYDDTEIKNNISDIKEEQTIKDVEQDCRILALENEKSELETELKEMQEDFYQNSIRGQARGEYIHVEDSSNCRAKIGIGGNSEQETRSGKNMLELMEGTYTHNGITAVVKNGIVTLNGTATGTSFVEINLLKSIELTNDKVYHVSAFNEKTVGDSTNYCSLRLIQANIQVLFNTANANSSITTNLEIPYITIRTSQGITYNNFVVKPQLELGAGTNEWEQGGVSPSPDYQSPVKTVGSNVNILIPKKYNNQTINGVTLNSNVDGSITLNGTMEEAGTICIVNTTFSISKDSYGFSIGETKLNSFNIFIQKTDYTNIVLLEIGRTTAQVIKELDAMSIKSVNMYINKGAVFNNYVIKPKLEKKRVTTYSPYSMGSVKVTKCNKNILKNIATSGALNGVTRTVNEDKSVTINGTSTGWANLTVGTIKGDGNSYTLSGSLSNSEIFLSVNNSQEGDIAQSKNGNEITFIPKRGLTYNVIICIPSGKTFNNVLIKPLVRISSDKDNTYEQHEEQSYIMPVQQEMLEGDYFDFDNEEEVHTWNKLVLKGSEEFNSWTGNAPSGYKVFYSRILTNAINSQGDLKCNALKYIENPWESGKNAIGLQRIFKEVYISIESKYASTLEEFKTYLKSQYDAGTPVTIYYKLATPTRLPFTDEQKAVAKELNNARTYKNVTNITTDSKAILSLDYAKDLETLLNNTQALAVNNASEGV